MLVYRERDNMLLKDIIKKSNKIVILSGAGVSTASGLKDFRSSEGLYKNASEDPTVILSRKYYYAHPQQTINYIVDNFIINEHIKPNKGHEFANYLLQLNKLTGVITQNVDGLYQKTHLPTAYLVEIHGNGHTFICTKCDSKVNYLNITKERLSNCCNAILDTDVVLYGDNFKSNDYNRYANMLNSADTVIVMGTSLQISAHLYNIMNVPTKVLINKEKINFGGQSLFDYEFIGDINEVLEDQLNI